MKEELEELGIELAKLAKKHDANYLTVTYTDKAVIGNEDPMKQGYESIYINERKVEERCLKN